MAKRQPFDLGRQHQAVLIGPYGRIDMPKVTSFRCKQKVKKEEVTPLNSPPEEQHIPQGWEGSFELVRTGRGIEDTFSRMEREFWAGTPIPYSTLYTYFAERDGSVTAYVYENVSIALEDSGDMKASESIKQVISFSASERNPLS